MVETAEQPAALIWWPCLPADLLPVLYLSLWPPGAAPTGPGARHRREGILLKAVAQATRVRWGWWWMPPAGWLGSSREARGEARETIGRDGKVEVERGPLMEKDGGVRTRSAPRPGGRGMPQVQSKAEGSGSWVAEALKGFEALG